MSNSRTIPIAIIVGGIIVALSVYLSLAKSTVTPTGDTSLVRPVGASDHILGNPSAPVMIIEYADFDCEFCKTFHDTLHQLVASEGTSGQVAWVLREFPLTEVHPTALAHARAAECVASVAGNDTFWKFIDALYAHQPVDPESYGTLAASVGLSGESFATCYASAATAMETRIMADRQNALDVGATGAPYALIVSPHKAPIVVDGAYSYTDLKGLLDQALAR